jgi:murein DD-endopeptidase MepM/ murein hydrolase activator NlpD
MPDGRWIGVALGGFAAGVVAMALLVQTFPAVVPIVTPPASPPAAGEGRATAPPRDAVIAPAPQRGSCVAARETPVLAAVPKAADAIADLRQRGLDPPIATVARRDLRSSFHEKRGTSRTHEAIDIPAPRHTPVRAVEDGCIAKLFASRDGGLTIYQFDPDIKYVYYYAHLERYAEGLHDGADVDRGQVIGYVGTSGNAPEHVPHLHLAIFLLTPERRWWKGVPIDPYEVWKP